MAKKKVAATKIETKRPTKNRVAINVKRTKKSVAEEVPLIQAFPVPGHPEMLRLVFDPKKLPEAKPPMFDINYYG